jgi:hypothetical protein
MGVDDGAVVLAPVRDLAGIDQVLYIAGRKTMNRCKFLKRVSALVGLSVVSWWMAGIAWGADNASGGATVQSINQQALRCITSIKFELIALSNRFPAFRQVGSEQIVAAKPTSKNVSCSLSYRYLVHYIDGREFPDENGVFLAVGIREHMPDLPTTRRYRVTIGKRRMTAYYRLELGKNMNNMEAPVRTVLEKNLQQFRDQAERMK